MKAKLSILIAAVTLMSCNSNKNNFDAQGNFEATEVIVSVEGSGKIVAMDFQEGDQLVKGQVVGAIDTTQLVLKRAQLQATIKALEAKVPEVVTQINVLKEQLSAAKRERDRTERLVATESAPQKQLDDQNSQISLIESQIRATNSQLSTQTKGILAEIEPIKAQIAQVNDQIAKSQFYAPISGTVLSKYAEYGEFTTVGKPLFKIADMSKITLKAYVAGDQLSELKIGQIVEVYTDKVGGEYNKYSGKVTWISDKSEFAPKVIQTKQERTNLVYAFKVVVENDGSIKIGMPGEVKF